MGICVHVWHMCAHVQICAYLCVHACVCACMYAHECMHVYVCMCMFMHMWVHMCLYACTQRPEKGIWCPTLSLCCILLTNLELLFVFPLTGLAESKSQWFSFLCLLNVWTAGIAVTHPAYYIDIGIWSPVLMLEQQVFLASNLLLQPQTMGPVLKITCYKFLPWFFSINSACTYFIKKRKACMFIVDVWWRSWFIE